jgi:hypothetical protein
MQEKNGLSEITIEKKFPDGLFKRPLPETCIDFSSQEGKKLFGESLANSMIPRYFFPAFFFSRNQTKWNRISDWPANTTRSLSRRTAAWLSCAWSSTRMTLDELLEPFFVFIKFYVLFVSVCKIC